MTRGATHGRRMPSWVIGLIVIVVLAGGTILAFSSLLGLSNALPWNDAYEVKAVFESAQNLSRDAPVRIAGVNVGKVTTVEHLDEDDPELMAAAGDEQSVDGEEVAGTQAAVVTMQLEEEARPIAEDATMKLRPRLFLEGNYFVDLQPGSPNAEEVEEGHVFPVNQTAYSVQLDQILTTLQANVRTQLQVLLDQLGNAFIKHGGAEGFRELYRTSAPSFKFTSQVNEAFLGTEPGDLGGVIRGLDRVVRGLGRNEEALKGLVSNFATFTGSFAAEDVALGRAIEELPEVLEVATPAFNNLNASLPALRAFAREALPGVRTTPETLQVATPFIEQVRALVSKRELRGLVADLRPTIPDLAKLAKRSIPFMKQARRLSSCFNEVIIPWSNDSVEPVDPTGIYPHDPPGRVFEETGYVITGLNGIGRNGDANGQWGRVLGQSGNNIVEFPDSFGLTPFPLLGAMPGKESSQKTRLTDDHPCERQEPPSLEATMGNAPPQTQVSRADTTALEPEQQELLAKLGERIAAAQESDSRGALADAQRALGQLGLGADVLGGEG